MQRSHVLVVGLDTSPRAPAVLDEAVRLAHATHAKLWVVRAVGLPQEVPHEALGISPEALPDKLASLARGALDAVLADVPAGLIAGVEARIGAPWQVLCAAAEEQKADTLVVGAHGHTIFLDRVIGTTASRVVAHAPCSVLLVRERA